MHPAGLPFVGASLAAAVAGRKHRWAWTAGLAAAAANAAFFRHPRRVPPTRPGVVVAPADGEICLIDTVPAPPELGLSDEPRLRVSIFLSMLDAHVQRAPIGGEVIAAVHQPGRFGTADLPAASDHNERTSVVIRTPEGVEVIAVQIAGLVARRILNYKEAGDQLVRGQRFGFIRFGSRVDLYLPLDTKVKVSIGEKVYASTTLLAELA